MSKQEIVVKGRVVDQDGDLAIVADDERVISLADCLPEAAVHAMLDGKGGPRGQFEIRVRWSPCASQE